MPCRHDYSRYYTFHFTIRLKNLLATVISNVVVVLALALVSITVALVILARARDGDLHDVCTVLIRHFQSN